MAWSTAVLRPPYGEKSARADGERPQRGLCKQEGSDVFQLLSGCPHMRDFMSEMPCWGLPDSWLPETMRSHEADSCFKPLCFVVIFVLYFLAEVFTRSVCLPTPITRLSSYHSLTCHVFYIFVLIYLPDDENFFFFSWGHTHSIWKFLGSGSNWPAAAGLHHNHSNMGSEPHPRPAPQLTATLDP